MNFSKIIKNAIFNFSLICLYSSLHALSDSLPILTDSMPLVSTSHNDIIDINNNLTKGFVFTQTVSGSGNTLLKEFNKFISTGQNSYPFILSWTKKNFLIVDMIVNNLRAKNNIKSNKLIDLILEAQQEVKINSQEESMNKDSSINAKLTEDAIDHFFQCCSDIINKKSKCVQKKARLNELYQYILNWTRGYLSVSNQVINKLRHDKSSIASTLIDLLCEAQQELLEEIRYKRIGVLDQDNLKALESEMKQKAIEKLAIRVRDTTNELLKDYSDFVEYQKGFFSFLYPKTKIHKKNLAQYILEWTKVNQVISKYVIEKLQLSNHINALELINLIRSAQEKIILDQGSIIF